MKLQKRIDLLVQLGSYIQQNDEEWQVVKYTASKHNGWFTPEFIDLAANNIVGQFLQSDKLKGWADQYHIKDTVTAKNVGIVMAGNIPLV